ncbi:uncharacterized protein LOC121428495 isoform X2 [Lytechinus variegatus]|uniref:uncharacterized protein LOC121428495 isoform X2 n=1 Tax=Lytechinus variegatus TaxID=7654 RepID=UPI001BB1AACA|nr:uncharacterized protein LOC121428495 isoform X2 [Lytechinus variegatus]
MGGPDRPRRGKGGSLADNSPKPKRPSPADNSAAQNDDTDGDDSTLSDAIQAAIDKLLTNENFISKLVSAIKTKLLDEICESLRSEVRDSLKFDIDNANDKMALLEKRVDVVEDAMDDAEQYSRRNCLIFAGINETQDEDVERKIVNICKEDLGVTINESDVDRCHRLGNITNKGKKTRKQHRDVIVKFTNYRKRDSIYKARFNLRKSSSPISIYVYCKGESRCRHFLLICGAVLASGGVLMSSTISNNAQLAFYLTLSAMTIAELGILKVTLCQARCPPDAFPVALAIVEIIFGTSQLLGTSIAGYLAYAFADFNASFIYLLVVETCIFIVMVILRCTKQRTENAAKEKQ